nr:FtsX-like permease family protein [Pseudomarimonas arenosa]
MRIAWRLLRRDLRSGEVRVLLFALVLAVTAISSVGFLTDRAGRALELQANALLGGDALIRADQPIADGPRALAAELGLRSSETRSFPSMLRVGSTLRLSDLKAMSAEHPLRGSYRLINLEGQEVIETRPPPAGEIWLSRNGADRLAAKLGDPVVVGARTLRLTGFVIDEPDSALDYFNFAPRAFFALEELPATELELPGSRITYRFAVAGAPGAVETWVAAQKDSLGRGQRLETAADARPEIRSALNRADRFLGLAAMIAVILAGVAVAMASRRHVQHHLDGCAVMRCMGASQRTLLSIHVGELVWLGLLGSALGLALAWLLQYSVGSMLEQVMGLPIPGAGWRPAVHGVAVAGLVLMSFALPPLISLSRVPSMRVLRRDMPAGSPSAWATLGLGVSGLIAMLWWQAADLTLAAVVLGGVAGTLLVLAGLGALLVLGLRGLRSRARGVWRFGLASLGRRSAGSIVQISALGLGLMAILLLTLVRTDLIARWQQAIPAHAPNRFLVNVQPDQLEAVRQRLRQAGVEQPALYPMVRGRLVSVNAQAVSADDYAEEGRRARRLAEREFNLSTMAELRSDNEVVEGQYWTAANQERAQLSVEQGLATTLGWKLGDRIGFDLAGSRVEGEITSLRKVDWESFQPNFFVLMSPGMLEGYPTSHISALRVPDQGKAVLNAMLTEMPNISMVDIDAILQQVQRTADQVATAVEYVFAFTLIAGLLVLFAAISASQDERLLEGGVMRAFGASRRQVRAAQLTEFALIGGLSGSIGAIAANVISGLVSSQVFDLPWQFNASVASAGMVAGTLLVMTAGLWATRRILASSPATTLRALQS